MQEDSSRRQEIEKQFLQAKAARVMMTQRKRVKKWRLDTTMSKMALQGLLAFAIGALVGLGAFVLFHIALA